MEITAKIMIITEIRFPTNALTGHIISNLLQVSHVEKI
jgi:hypothetical protein